MTPSPRPRGAPPRGVPPSRSDDTGRPPADGVRWLRPAEAAPRAVDRVAIGRRLDNAGCDSAAWRAAQLTALLVGADSDAGPGGVEARWNRGVRVRSFDLASRAGVAVIEVERALEQLLALDVLRVGEGASGEASSAPDDDPRRELVVRVAADYVSEGPASAVAWPIVAERLSGSAAGLLVARALADHVDRPGRPTVVPYSALAADTRYSEGMIKRGAAAAVASGVVVQRASPGRAPAYAFSDWALGRGDAPRDVTGAHTTSSIAPPTSGHGRAVPSRPVERQSPPPLGSGDAAPVLRASVAGVSFEVPASCGGELVVETVLDGRPVTARLVLPAARDHRQLGE